MAQYIVNELDDRNLFYFQDVDYIVIIFSETLCSISQNKADITVLNSFLAIQVHLFQIFLRSLLLKINTCPVLQLKLTVLLNSHVLF